MSEFAIGAPEGSLLTVTSRTRPREAAVGQRMHLNLRRKILRNELAPGTRMSEIEIAAAFDVSRQPVREAFIKLAEEGLLEVRPQRGTFVKKISIKAVMDARFVREAVEADVVRSAARRHDAATAAELRRQIAAQKQVPEDDYEGFLQLDELFHQTLAEAGGVSGAWQVLEVLKLQMDRVRYLSLMRFPIRRLLAQHEAVAEAVAAGDEDAAEAAMRGHLREILGDLPEIAKARPELFEPSEGEPARG